MADWNRSAGRIATGLFLTLGAGCDSARTDEDNCKRFLRIYDDLDAGKIGSDVELKERLDEDVGSFKEGSSLRETLDSLIAAIDTVDESQANTATNSLAEQCSTLAEGEG